MIDCCTREITGWHLLHRLRTEDALAAVEQAVMQGLPEGGRKENLTLTTENGTQFTSSRFMETLGRLRITSRRTAYHHPEGNSYIEQFRISLKEEEVWTAEYQNLEEARASIARWIDECNHERPHRGVQNRTPHEAFLAFAAVPNMRPWLAKLAGSNTSSFLRTRLGTASDEGCSHRPHAGLFRFTRRRRKVPAATHRF